MRCGTSVTLRKGSDGNFSANRIESNKDTALTFSALDDISSYDSDLFLPTWYCTDNNNSNITNCLSMMKSLLLLLFWLTSNQTAAFVPSTVRTPPQTPMFNHIDRRLLLKRTLPVALSFAGLLLQQQPAIAAGSPPSPDDLNRIKKGYEQIQYLLANFEQETTVCRENGGECKRDAEPIRKGKPVENTRTVWIALPSY